VPALLVLALAAAAASMGAPRLTLLNTDVRVAYPWYRPGAALLAAAAAAAAAVLLRRGWARALAGALALAAALAAAHLALYRVRAGADGLEARTLLGAQRLAWSAVARVETAPGLLLLTGTDGRKVRVDTTDFRAEDRATLDRTVARRLRTGS
jgi:hypothetical protein